MYPDFLMVAHAETQGDQEMISIKNKENLDSFIAVEENQEYRSRVQMNENFIGDQLLPASRSRNDQLKYLVKNKGIEVVVVSPQIAALQTCLDFFGQEEGIEIFVEPLLHPRINSTANIPSNVQDLLSKFKVQPFSSKIEDKSWFLNFGHQSSTIAGQESNPQDQCLQIMRKYGAFESVDQYLQRNVNLRKQLFDYIQKTKKKVAIITHPMVLEALTATGWHEDGKLVNPVRFDFGDVKSQNVWIEGVQAEQEESVPFCGR